MLWLRARFARDSCRGSFNGTYKCAERYSTILNGCQTNTIDAKLGGTLEADCASYALTVVDSHTDPFKDNREASTGDFTCEDYQAVAPDDKFAGTCNCWVSARPKQTAKFVKPPNGKCDGQSVDRVDGMVAGQGY